MKNQNPGSPNKLPKSEFIYLLMIWVIRNNVCDKYPEVVAELQELLTRYILDGRSTPIFQLNYRSKKACSSSDT